jgi:hypothetical protein
MTSLFDIERKQSGEFPSLTGKYTRGQAHLKADHQCLIEHSPQHSIIGVNSIEHSAKLPFVPPIEQLVN